MHGIFFTSFNNTNHNSNTFLAVFHVDTSTRTTIDSHGVSLDKVLAEQIDKEPVRFDVQVNVMCLDVMT